MAVEIIDAGGSIQIVTDGVSRFITKHQVKEVSILKNDIIRLDIGAGALSNHFIDYGEVTAPVLPSAAALRDEINNMLKAGASGYATKAKQEEELTQLQTLQLTVDEMKLDLAALNDKAMIEPILVDETNPQVVYKGYANPGANPAQPDWAILKISNDAGIFTYQWADGNKQFDNIWDNRETLSYS